MKIRTYLAFFILALTCTTMVSCTKMDDYKKYISAKEPIYTGKADSVKVYSGKNRIKLSWLLISDPKIVKTKVFWNNRKDSTVIAINRTKGIDTITTIINNLAEGNYNFELLTYDKNGNSSVSVPKSGVVYGSIYETSLLNRAVKNVKWQPGGNTFVNWYPSDNNSIGVQLTYGDNSGINHTLIVPTTDNATTIVNYNSNKLLSYRTMFKPDSSAIDTFYAVNTTVGINQILLKNAEAPFLYSNLTGGRWGNLQDWIVNAPCQNHGGVGGFDNYNGGSYISMEYWGTPAINNGKIYQTLTLPAGAYRLVATISAIYGPPEATYLTVANGNTLPDIANINQAIGTFKLNNSSNGNDITVSFSLSQATQVSVGFATTMLIQGQTSIRISKVQLYKD